jgi:transcriptional regulator with XRE-family HTH domain
MSSKSIVTAKIENNTTPLDLERGSSEGLPAELVVGMKIRQLRGQNRLSLRVLAELSGLNINTLSLIENGKSSPSVGTLHQLARALKVPINAFFETDPVPRRVVFTSHDSRPDATLNNTRLENLGKDLAGNAVQPFVVTLEPGGGSGNRMVVHTGYEFVYCLSGKICYIIAGETYLLQAGDTVVFEAHLPHRWQNIHEGESKIILVLYPADQREEAGGRQFFVNKE